MNILVTGGRGFIGSRLVSRLVELGETVHVLDQTPVPINDPRSSVLHFQGTILSPPDLERAMLGCDRVYHLAAYARNWAPQSSLFFIVNVRGTENVLNVAHRLRIRKVVHTSSNVTYGPSNGVHVDESSCRLTEFFTTYEQSKYMGETVVRSFVKQGLDVVIVNPTRVFGPGPLNESNSVTKMIAWYLQGKWRFVLGDGSAIGNYVYVEDLIDGYLNAMDRGRAGEGYILGGDNVSYDEFFHTVATCSQCFRRLVHLPSGLAIAFSKFEEFRSTWSRHYPLITTSWVRNFLAPWENSCAKAQKEIGYSFTPLESAVRSTISWLRDSEGISW